MKFYLLISINISRPQQFSGSDKPTCYFFLLKNVVNAKHLWAEKHLCGVEHIFITSGPNARQTIPQLHDSRYFIDINEMVAFFLKTVSVVLLVSRYCVRVFILYALQAEKKNKHMPGH